MQKVIRLAATLCIAGLASTANAALFNLSYDDVSDGVDPDVLVLAARRDGTDHREPEHYVTYEFIRPGNGDRAAKELPVDDLENGDEDHRRQQDD